MERLKRLLAGIRGMFYYLRLGKERKLSLGSVLEKQARKRPGKTCLIFNDREYTYQEINEAANRYSHLFLSRSIKKGDTVALLMENRPEYLIVHAGLAKIGAVPALLNNNIRGDVLVHAINIASAKVLIVGHELLEEYLAIADRIKLEGPELVFLEKESTEMNTPEGMEDPRPLLQSSPRENPGATDSITSSDILEYIYTSGTTGMPKATVLKHQKWLQLGFAGGGFAIKAIDTDVQYFCLPLYHNSGINIAWATTLISGGTIVLKRKFSASSFWDDIRKYQATIFIYIGELCRYLNNQPKRPNDGDNTLKTIMGNGMRKEYWSEFQERFQIERIIEVYGATEGVGGLTNTKGVPGMIGQLTTAGIFRMGELAKYDRDSEELIRDANGRVQKCKVGETGIFLAKITSKNPFSGYKSNKKATNSKILENVFKPGDKYFMSGDLFKLHEDTYVSFVDRLGDTFKWKGEVVSTNEVADIINKYGQIDDANVYGVTVEKAEGRAGMVTLTPLADEVIDWDRFSSYITENLAVYARPYFARLSEKADATTSFKQLKTRLKAEGFNPEIISEPLFFLDPMKKQYVKLTPDIYENIQNGSIRF